METRSRLEQSPVATALALFKADMQQELEVILSWWIKNMVDREYGGFYGRMDGFGQLHRHADKGVILNTRLLWTFSAAAQFTGSTQYHKMADRAYEYISHYFWDNEAGGVFWMLDYTGEVIQSVKQIYAQAFAIYAFSEYYALTQKKEALAKAQELFWLVEKYSKDKVKEGYLNVFGREWLPHANQQLSEKDEDQSKIMNTHLHMMEAYANLHRVAPSEWCAQALRYVIRLILDKFCQRQPRHLYIYFDDNWLPTSEERSFGHDIECSWLMVEAAEILGDGSLLSEVREVALELLQSVLENGRDAAGGIYEKTDHSGQYPIPEKHWWPQAEAVVGFLDAYRHTKSVHYFEAAKQSWLFIKRYFRDEVQGEWHWMIDQNGQPILDREDKAGTWKAPYHNSRMCMEALKRLG